jgi:FixJ family two-component response regulator
MPRMSGPQLYRELVASGRRMRVLFTSGYAEREATGSESLDQALPFVMKPWTVTEFLSAIRDALDREPPAPLA